MQPATTRLKPIPRPPQGNGILRRPCERRGKAAPGPGRELPGARHRFGRPFAPDGRLRPACRFGAPAGRLTRLYRPLSLRLSRFQSCSGLLGQDALLPAHRSCPTRPSASAHASPEPAVQGPSLPPRRRQCDSDRRRRIPAHAAPHCCAGFFAGRLDEGGGWASLNRSQGTPPRCGTRRPPAGGGRSPACRHKCPRGRSQLERLNLD